jgi:hypothetical protein
MRAALKAWADVIGWLRRYAASDDPRVATANLVALVLAWNTPFYPLYLLGAAGEGIRSAAWLTLCSLPFFLSVPAMTRLHPLWGRVLLVVIGTGNTLFCTWVVGEASGTQLFLLPCVTLAALLFRRKERWPLVCMLTLPIAAWLALDGRYPVSPFVCTGGDACRAILRLNEFSVAVLTAFLGWLATGLIESGPAPMRRPETRRR